MADGLLDMIIQSADFEKLNVKPGDVLKGKLYVGPTARCMRGRWRIGVRRRCILI